MAGDKQADTLVDLDFVPVDFTFAIAHTLNQLEITGFQRFDRILNHGFYQAAHFQKLGADRFEIGRELPVGMLVHNTVRSLKVEIHQMDWIYKGTTEL